jgi:uncharacterized protein (DUF697 family)/uncharacterized tellurite resistance protein B-like protein
MKRPESALIAEFDDVTRVVADPLRFKSKLSIGDEAYATLKATRVLGDVWQVGTAAAAGGAVAGSSAVAGTFFGGWLTALGVATAITPAGWVIGAAAASGAACYGVLQLFRRYESSRVVKVPAFINTPIDFLGASLFDLMATLAIRVAQEAGDLDADERASIREYFVEEWGFDPDYVAAALPVIEQKASDGTIEEIAANLAEFKRSNPDCNLSAMSAELIAFLKEIAEADGHLDDAELAAIKRVEAVFYGSGSWNIATLGSAVVAAPRTVYEMLPSIPQWSKTLFGSGAAEEDGAADPALTVSEIPLPVVWLLGKTGAGKTSLIRSMTGATVAEIGNGFEPCTRTASAYDFPADLPVMRFLDTRGLGEAHYDPTDDLAVCQSASHVVLVLARLDDPVQGAVAETLADLKRRNANLELLVLHTAAGRLDDKEAKHRAMAKTQAVFEAAWGQPVPSLEIELSDPDNADLGPLHDELLGILPSVAVLLDDQTAKDGESAAFIANRPLILRYAATAASSGAVPIVGTATVPAVQIAMLASLASAYKLEWNRSQLALFAAALGGGVLGGQAIGMLGRQAASLVPVVGQFVVPALSASWGFASSYALGRAASYWMYQTSRGLPVDRDVLHARYAQAFKRTTTDAAD